MKNKYILTLEIESDKALKAVEKALLQEHRVSAFVETKRKTQNMPYICINWIDLKPADKLKGE